MDEDGRALALHTKKPTTLGCDILQVCGSSYLLSSALFLFSTEPFKKYTQSLPLEIKVVHPLQQVLKQA